LKFTTNRTNFQQKSAKIVHPTAFLAVYQVFSLLKEQGEIQLLECLAEGRITKHISVGFLRNGAMHRLLTWEPVAGQLTKHKPLDCLV